MADQSHKSPGSEIKNSPKGLIIGKFQGRDVRTQGEHTYKDKLQLKIGKAFYEYNVKFARAGSYNSVFYIYDAHGHEISDVLIRVAMDAGKETPEQKQERAANFDKECEFVMKLGSQSIGPKIYAKLEIDGRFGLACERFEYSLDDVRKCPRLMRKLFLQFDGENEIVRLYLLSSGIIRCVDTKPGNVVVRFAEKRPRLALIDVDGTFCNPPPVKNRGKLDDSASYLASLNEALRKLSNGTIADESPSSAIAATSSLLVFCTVAAVCSTRSTSGFGFPYIRIAQVLLDNWEVVTKIAEADRQMVDNHTMTATTSGRITVIGMVGTYLSPKSGNDVVDVQSEADLRLIMYELKKLLSSEIKSTMSSALRVCRSEDGYAGSPWLYEYSAFVIKESGKNDTAFKDKEDLKRRVAVMHETKIIKATCAVDGCTKHKGQEIAKAGAKRKREDPEDPQYPQDRKDRKDRKERQDREVKNSSCTLL